MDPENEARLKGALCTVHGVPDRTTHRRIVNGIIDRAKHNQRVSFDE